MGNDKVLTNTTRSRVAETRPVHEKKPSAYKSKQSKTTARSRSRRNPDAQLQTVQKLPGTVRKGRGQLKPHPKREKPGGLGLKQVPLPASQQKSKLRVPTKRSEKLTVMPWDDALEVLKKTNRHENKGKKTVETKYSGQIMEAVKQYKELPELLDTALKSGKPEDYEAVTMDLIDLLVIANRSAGVNGDDEEAEMFVADGSVFAEAVLTRIFLPLDEKFVENLMTLLDGKAQEFVNSIPIGEAGKSNYRLVQTKAATAVNIMQNALYKRVKNNSKGGLRTERFKLSANTEHRYREKPLIPTGRAIVNVAMADSKHLGAARKVLGDGLEWLIGETPSKARWQFGAQLKAMPPEDLKIIANMDVEETINGLSWLNVSYQRSGVPAHSKDRYSPDQLSAMRDLLIFAKLTAERLA